MRVTEIWCGTKMQEMKPNDCRIMAGLGSNRSVVRTTAMLAAAFHGEGESLSIITGSGLEFSGRCVEAWKNRF